MRSTANLLICFSLLLVARGGSGDVVGTVDSSPADSGPTVTYVTAETFDEEVLRSDVPVLVDFTATWCVPCKVVDPIIMSLYPEMAPRARIFKLDIDKDLEIYQRLGETVYRTSFSSTMARSRTVSSARSRGKSTCNTSRP